MVYILVNSEAASFYQTPTDQYIDQHGYDLVCNDYISQTSSNGVVRLLFQPANQRPVFAGINCVPNSPAHKQYELLLTDGRYGDTDFSAEIVNYRSAIDAVQAPHQPPVLSNPRWLDGGRFEFTLTGQAARFYRIEASPDFQTWTTIATNLPGDVAGVRVQDPTVSSFKRRLYRAVQQ